MARYRGSARWAANKFGKAVARNYVRKKYGSNRGRRNNSGCAVFVVILVGLVVVVAKSSI